MQLLCHCCCLVSRDYLTSGRQNIVEAKMQSFLLKSTPSTGNFAVAYHMAHNMKGSGNQALCLGPPSYCQPTSGFQLFIHCSRAFEVLRSSHDNNVVKLASYK